MGDQPEDERQAARNRAEEGAAELHRIAGESDRQNAERLRSIAEAIRQHVEEIRKAVTCDACGSTPLLIS